MPFIFLTFTIYKMKHLTAIISILFLLSLDCISQENNLKNKSVEILNNTILFYSLDSEKNIHGDYYINNLSNNTVWLKGQYSSNKKSGKWFVFNSTGNLIISYDFNKNGLTYIDSKLFEGINYSIDSESNNKNLPIPLFSFELLFKGLSELGSIESSIKSNEKLFLVADIDKNGNVKFYLIDSNNNELKQNLNLNFNKYFNFSWIPAKADGETVNSKIIFNLNIEQKLDSETKRFRWNY